MWNCNGKLDSPKINDSDRQKTFYKYFNVNFHPNLQQYMLINNSSQLYIPNNTLHNNWLKQICRISQKVWRGDWTGDVGRSGDFGTSLMLLALAGTGSWDFNIRKRSRNYGFVSSSYLAWAKINLIKRSESVSFIVIHRRMESFWCVCHP